MGQDEIKKVNGIKLNNQDNYDIQEKEEPTKEKQIKEESKKASLFDSENQDTSTPKKFPDELKPSTGEMIHVFDPEINLDDFKDTELIFGEKTESQPDDIIQINFPIGNLHDALNSISEGAIRKEEVKELHKAIQKGFAGRTSLGNLDDFYSSATYYVPQEVKFLDDLKYKAILPQEKEQVDKFIHKVTGMSLQELEDKIKEDPHYTPKILPGALEQNHDELNYLLQTTTYGKDFLTMISQFSANGLKIENDKVRENFDEINRDEGFIQFYLNMAIYLCRGTTKGDVDAAIKERETQAQELYKLATTDIIKFMKKYREITGVDFNIENFLALRQAENAFSLAVHAKNLQDISQKLYEGEYSNEDQTESRVQTDMGVMPGASVREVRIPGKHNYGFSPNGTDLWFREPSPLEAAVINLYDGDRRTAQEWVDTRIKELHLENKSQREIYKALVKDFQDSLKVITDKTFKEKSYEKISEEYKAALQAAYGRNIPQEKLDDYVANQASAKQYLDIGILIGAGMFMGPAGLACFMGGMSAANKMSSQNGFHMEDIPDLGMEMGLTYASFKMFEVVSKTTANGMINHLKRNGKDKLVDAIVNNTPKVISPQTKLGLLVKGSSTAAGGSVTGFTFEFGGKLIQGKDFVEALQDGFSGAAKGASFALLFCAFGETVSAIKKSEWNTLRTAKNDLYKALKNDSNPALNQLAKKMKKEGLSKELLRDILRQSAKVYHPDVGGNPETMAKYNSLLNNLGKMIKDIPSQTKAAFATDTTPLLPAPNAEPVKSPLLTEEGIHQRILDGEFGALKNAKEKDVKKVFSAFAKEHGLKFEKGDGEFVIRDANGNVVREAHQGIFDGRWYDHFQVFDANNNITHRFVLNSQGKLQSAVEYFYDAAGKKIMSVGYGGKAEKSVMVFKGSERLEMSLKDFVEKFKITPKYYKEIVESASTATTAKTTAQSAQTPATTPKPESEIKPAEKAQTAENTKNLTQYPSLKLTDAISLFKESLIFADNPEVQAEIGTYMDALLENIPKGMSGNGDSIKPFTDYVLSDGTVISRNPLGDEKILLDKFGWSKGVDFSSSDKILLWVKEPNGSEHFLPCLSKENYVKAKQICDYLVTQKSIPRNEIEKAQAEKIAAAKARNNSAETTGAKSLVTEADIAMKLKDEYTQEELSLITRGVNEGLISHTMLYNYRSFYLADIVKSYDYKKANNIFGVEKLDLSSTPKNISAADAAKEILKLDISDAGYTDGKLQKRFEKIFGDNAYSRLKAFNDLPVEVKKAIAGISPGENPILQKVLDTIPTEQISTIEKFRKVMDDPEIEYNIKPHSVVLGNETVSVETSFLIHLLTGRQYPAGTDKFNQITETLVEKSCKGKEEPQYAKIVEGILSQKPELIEICDAYVKYVKSIRTKDEIARKLLINEFFNQLEQNGIIPKNIELKTVVPDENALMKPQDTVNVVRKRLNSQSTQPAEKTDTQAVSPQKNNSSSTAASKEIKTPYPKPDKPYKITDVIENYNSHSIDASLEDCEIILHGLNEGIIKQKDLYDSTPNSLIETIKSFEYKVENGILGKQTLDLSGVTRDITAEQAAKLCAKLDISDTGYTDGSIEKSFLSIFDKNVYQRLLAFDKLPFEVKKLFLHNDKKYFCQILDSADISKIKTREDYYDLEAALKRKESIAQVKQLLTERFLPAGSGKKIEGDFAQGKVQSYKLTDPDSVFVMLTKNFNGNGSIEDFYISSIERGQEFRFIVNENGEKELVLPVEYAQKYSDKAAFVSGSGKLYDADGNPLSMENFKTKTGMRLHNLLKNRSYTHSVFSKEVNSLGQRCISEIMNETQNFDEIVQKFKTRLVGEREISPEAQEVLEARVRFLINNIELIDAELSRVRPNLLPRRYYRGVSGEAADVFKTAPIGSTIMPDTGYAFASREDSYTSFARDNGVMLEIDAFPGAQVSKIPNLLNQVLIKRNTKYKVVDRWIDENGITHVKLKMKPAPGSRKISVKTTSDMKVIGNQDAAKRMLARTAETEKTDTQIVSPQKDNSSSTAASKENFVAKSYNGQEVTIDGNIIEKIIQNNPNNPNCKEDITEIIDRCVNCSNEQITDFLSAIPKDGIAQIKKYTVFRSIIPGDLKTLSSGIKEKVELSDLIGDNAADMIFLLSAPKAKSLLKLSKDNPKYLNIIKEHRFSISGDDFPADEAVLKQIFDIISKHPEFSNGMLHYGNGILVYSDANGSILQLQDLDTNKSTTRSIVKTDKAVEIKYAQDKRTDIDLLQKTEKVDENTEKITIFGKSSAPDILSAQKDAVYNREFIIYTDPKTGQKATTINASMQNSSEQTTLSITTKIAENTNGNTTTKHVVKTGSDGKIIAERKVEFRSEIKDNTVNIYDGENNLLCSQTYKRAGITNILREIPAESLYYIVKQKCRITQTDTFGAKYTHDNSLQLPVDSPAACLHEAGHVMEKNLFDQQLRTDKALKDLYNKELSEIPSYLSQDVGYFVGLSGLSEIIAEGNMLINSPDTPFGMRAYFLQRYFPKTLAKIQEMIYLQRTTEPVGNIPASAKPKTQSQTEAQTTLVATPAKTATEKGIKTTPSKTVTRNKGVIKRMLAKTAQKAKNAFGSIYSGRINDISSKVNNDAWVANSHPEILREQLELLKDDKGFRRFSDEEIRDIMRSVTVENRPLLEKLITDKNADGSLLYGFQIASFLEHIKSKDIPVALKLLNMTDKNGNHICNILDAKNLLDDGVKKHMLNFEEYAKMTDAKGNRAFSVKDALFLAQNSIRSSQISLVKKLAKLADENGNPLLSFVDYEEIFRWYDHKFPISDKKAVENIKILASIKNTQGERIFTGDRLINIAVYLPDSINYAKELANIKNSAGNTVLDAVSIENIVRITDVDYLSNVEKLAQLTNEDGEPLLSESDYPLVIHYIFKDGAIAEDKIPILKKVASIKDSQGRKFFRNETLVDMVNMMSDASEKRFSYAKELAKMKSKFDSNIYEKDDVYEIMKATTEENLLIAKEVVDILKDKVSSYDGYDVARIIRIATKENLPKIRELSNIVDEYGFPILNSEDIFALVSVKDSPSRFKQVIVTYTKLKNAIGKIKDAKSKSLIEEKIKAISKSVDKMIEPIPISKETLVSFGKNFFVSADPQNAKVIKGLDTIVEKYGETGLPLGYQRNDFVKDLKTKLKTLPQDKQSDILNKLEIELQDDTYEGFINLAGLDSSVPEEAAIQKICEKFLLNNKINTGDAQTDKFLNSIIEAMPEWVNIVGKVQHGTHQYTLDIHTLKVLKEVVVHPKFEKLSDADKTVAQLTVLLHDIAKKGGVIDTGHELPSSVVANDILSKVNLPEFMRKRIIEMIKNHNWLQQINTGQISPEQAAVMFRNPEDATIAEIFANADLLGVGSGFYQIHSDAIKPSVAKMQKAITELYSTGNMLFPTKILNSEKIPVVEHDGHKYKVLDVGNLPPNADLRDYGFSVENPEDLRLLFHSGNWSVMDTLGKGFNDSVICTTLLSPSKHATYFNRDIGLMLDVPNANIVNSAPHNQGSGRGKGLQSFVEMVSSKNNNRAFQRDEFIKALGSKYNISENEYAEIYKAIMQKQFLSQIEDIKLSNGKIIKAEDVKKAYKTVEDAIMKTTQTWHNEINVYNPQIKGVIFVGKTLSEIDSSVLRFIREHDLPIIILKK